MKFACDTDRCRNELLGLPGQNQLRLWNITGRAVGYVPVIHLPIDGSAVKRNSFLVQLNTQVPPEGLGRTFACHVTTKTAPVAHSNCGTWFHLLFYYFLVFFLLKMKSADFHVTGFGAALTRIPSIPVRMEKEQKKQMKSRSAASAGSTQDQRRGFSAGQSRWRANKRSDRQVTWFNWRICLRGCGSAPSVDFLNETVQF